MSHFQLTSHRNSVHRASLPFKLKHHSAPSSIKEARQDAKNRRLASHINESLDQFEGILGRAARYDGQPEDLNQNQGEVLLLGQRFGRAHYDAYLKFDHLQGDGALIESAELECAGRPFFKMSRENDTISAKAYEFRSKREYLIAGELDGRATVS